jgi:hypothetical protein
MVHRISTLTFASTGVLDSLRIAGKRYVRCHNLWYFVPITIDTVRTDTLGNVWRLHGGVEEPIFRFNANPGDSWTFACSDSPNALRMQMKYVGILDSFQLSEGPLRSRVFRQVKAFYGEVPGLVDSWIGIAIARGVGVIYRGWSQMYQVLYGAAVNGTLIGDTTTTSVVGQPLRQIPRFWLHQNYPNPFNPSTTITFELERSSYVSLRIYDILGRSVATLVDERLPSGTHSVAWEPHGLPSGVYIYRLSSESSSQSRRTVLLR